MKQARFIQAGAPLADTRRAWAAEAAAGLLAQPAHVSPKFFYDALGSRLFDAITELPEYYPTRTEAEIMARHGPAIIDAVLGATGSAPSLVDLGAGSCAKAARLFDALQPRRYVAVDISADYLQVALAALQREHPHIDMLGLGLDFSAQFALPPGVADGRPALVFYPGSSIGNFGAEDALRLLQQARAVACGGALLIGVDLLKPAAVLEPAYDDELGVTAAFNLNLLNHLNRLLGSNFQPRNWQHVALFNSAASRIEMYLQARQAVQVAWPGGQRHFEAGERIHTENSMKWEPQAFEQLLRQAGFQAVRHWCDSHQRFAVFLAAS